MELTQLKEDLKLINEKTGYKFHVNINEDFYGLERYDDTGYLQKSDEIKTVKELLCTLNNISNEEDYEKNWWLQEVKHG